MRALSRQISPHSHPTAYQLRTVGADVATKGRSVRLLGRSHYAGQEVLRFVLPLRLPLGLNGSAQRKLNTSRQFRILSDHLNSPVKIYRKFDQ